MRRQKNTPIAIWVGLTLLAAVVQVPLVVLFHESAMAERPYTPKDRKRAVQVTLSPRKRRQARPEVTVEPEPMPRGQVVTVREPEVEEPPPRKSRYLANVDRRVKREVKARPSRRSRSRRLGATAPKEVSKVQSPRSRSLKPSASPKVDQKMELAAKAVKAPRVERGDTRPSTEMVRSNATRAILPTLDQKSALANIQTLTGASSSDDALLDVKMEGEETLLNTRKFQHWDFFNTVKTRVRKHWHPGNVYRRNDPTGKVYGVKDRLTVVQVTLTPEGKLKRLRTVKDSGVDFLDVEARRALSKAAPFRNPPQALVDERHQIVFQFGFLFEISTRRFKFFRM